MTEPEGGSAAAAAALPAPPRWGDLTKRLLSAVVIAGVGFAELWVGGPTFAALVIVLTGVMVWELARITAPFRRSTPWAIGLLAGAALWLCVALPAPQAAALLLAPSLVLALTPRRDRRISAVWGAAMMVSGFGLIGLRDGGTLAILWLIGIVVASDVLGYFVGRMLGGPKFWPRVSPKKTWLGTVAGWVGAALVGALFVELGKAEPLLIALSPLVAFAGQMGDIAESWIKRRAGVKDSSSLIPGHGGVMDRFDALTGAVVAVMLLDLVLPLPLLMTAG